MSVVRPVISVYRAKEMREGSTPVTLVYTDIGSLVGVEATSRS
jgi:hypothetical protein